MKVDGFEFQSDSLDYGAIEHPICRYYRLGFAESSSFLEIEEGKTTAITIIATNGSVECGVTAYRDKVTGKYKVVVARADVRYKK